MECWSLDPQIDLNHVHGPFLVWWNLRVLWTLAGCTVFTLEHLSRSSAAQSIMPRKSKRSFPDQLDQLF